MSTPTLHLHEKIAKDNIHFMHSKASKNKLEFRPHFKTHQSKSIGKWFSDQGINGITVSSAKMANYFSSDWKDITIAFPLILNDLDSYNAINSNCQINVLVTSADTLIKAEKGLDRNIGILIEIDGGDGRSGLKVNELNEIDQIIEHVESSSIFSFKGFYCHAGQTYSARSKKEIIEISDKSIVLLEDLSRAYTGVDICYGDTPSCSVREDFGPVTQLSAGNFVFYDWMQVNIGSCNTRQQALVMRCPVVEKYAIRKEVLIHGGAVHFSKDFIVINNRTIFGVCLASDHKAVGQITKLSQEHGILSCSDTLFDKIEVGTTVDIYPIHSCLTANLMGRYHTTNGMIIEDHCRSGNK